jgi:microsomal dipeptidase-like Zn-dependent dipeptidase
MKRMAELGAVMEFTWLAHLGAPSGPVAGAPVSPAVPVADCANAIKAVGAEHFIITSDLGQANTPLHTVGLRAFIAALKAEGLGDEAIALLTRKNPARLLGLE